LVSLIEGLARFRTVDAERRRGTIVQENNCSYEVKLALSPRPILVIGEALEDIWRIEFLTEHDSTQPDFACAFDPGIIPAPVGGLIALLLGRHAQVVGEIEQPRLS
jgi:hypothetical protein